MQKTKNKKIRDTNYLYSVNGEIGYLSRLEEAMMD